MRKVLGIVLLLTVAVGCVSPGTSARVNEAARAAAQPGATVADHDALAAARIAAAAERHESALGILGIAQGAIAVLGGGGLVGSALSRKAV